jgi:hypothetical protein
MSRSPYGRNDGCDALNGCVRKSGQDVGEVIADRDLEPSTTFHNQEDGGYARPSLFATDVDPVGAANCDRGHGILSEVGAQLQLWSERAPEWIQPGGINRLATCLTDGRFSAIRMEEGYLGLIWVAGLEGRTVAPFGDRREKALIVSPFISDSVVTHHFSRCKN